MLKSKKMVSMILAVAMVISMGTTVLAYPDGDREVKYYDFSIDSGEMVNRSSSSMVRLYDREWVVTISSRRNNSYRIGYGIITGVNTSWYNALVSDMAYRQGTGNTGSTYPSDASIGYSLYLGALINDKDVFKNVKTSGQWSTDAPW